MNSTEKTLILIAGSVMIVSGLFGVMSWSDRTGKLYGFGSWGQYAVAGHWWVLLFVGLIFSFTPLLSGPNNSKGVDQRLVRMAADLKKLKKQIEHYSLRDGVFSQLNNSDNNPPEIDAVGNPDEEGYEWITSEDGLTTTEQSEAMMNGSSLRIDFLVNQNHCKSGRCPMDSKTLH